MERRIRFLECFLGALGARNIEWTLVDQDRIQGNVVYDKSNPDEKQAFVWRVSEAQAPSEEVISLAALIQAEALLSIDKLTLSTNELRRRYSAYCGHIFSAAEFESILEELEKIEVPMLDDGIESDAYFIHQ